MAVKYIYLEKVASNDFHCVFPHIRHSETGATNGSSGSLLFVGNTAVNAGGAMFTTGLDSFHVSNTTFYRNKAKLGGAVYIALASEKASNFSNCMFDGNEGGDGGAVYLYTGGGVDIITSSVFRHNFAGTFFRYFGCDRRDWSNTFGR